MRRAFTLIELLVALAIGTFVVAALYSLFTVQLRQFVYQDIQMEMHQSIRLGMDVLTRTGRAAGMGTNGLIYGALGTGGSEANTLPAVISYDGTGPGGSDGITIVSMDPALVMYTNPDDLQSCSSTSISFDASRGGYASKLGDFVANEYLLCYDFGSPAGTRSLMWEITGVASASGGSRDIAGGTGTYGDFAGTCPASDNRPIGMECSRADVVTFYIDADDDDGVGAGSLAHPVLMMDLDFQSPDGDDIPVVDNVEDLQIEYCFRGDTCTALDWADSVDTYTDSNTANDADDIYMIRFTIVVRSAREDLTKSYVGDRLNVANNVPAASTDHYYRQILSAEVAVRNLRGLN